MFAMAVLQLATLAVTVTDLVVCRMSLAAGSITHLLMEIKSNLVIPGAIQRLSNTNRHG